MAAISRRGQGGRIYNNTRARVLLRRMCVKPAALTIHFPPKAFASPCTATRPPRALPPPPAAPTHAHAAPMHSPPTSQPILRRRLPLAPAQRHTLPEHFRSPTLRRCTPADCAMHSSPTSQHLPRRRPSPAHAQRHALPEHFRSPTQPRCTPADCAMHSSPSSQPVPAEGLRLPPHSDTPSPSTPAPPRSADARPPTARRIPRRPHNPFLAEGLHPPPHSDTLPFRSASGTKKTAPHSECAMPNVSVDRRAVGHLGW